MFSVSTPVHVPHYQSSHHQTVQQTTTQTWPFVEIYAHKRYFYLEAQSFCIDGHPEIFLWLWFLGKLMICKVDYTSISILLEL